MKILIINPRASMGSLVKDLESNGHEVDCITSIWYTSFAAIIDQYPNAIIAENDDDFSEKLWNLAKSKKYNYIFPSQTDGQSLLIAKVNNYLGIPGASVQAVSSITSKEIYYKIWHDLGIPCPKVWEVNWKDGKIKLDSSVTFPCVVKPTAGTAGNGVELFTDSVRLKMKLHACQEKMLVQEYIPGDTISVSGHVHKGQVFVDMIHDIEVAKPFLAEMDWSCPSKHFKFKDVIVNYLDKFFNHIGLDNCPFMLDAMIENDKIYFIDFGARISRDVDFIYYMGNKFYLRDLVYKLSSDIQTDFKIDGAVIRKTLGLEKGKIKSFSCDDTLVNQIKYPENEIKDIFSDVDIFLNGYVTVTGITVADANQKYNIFKDTIKVSYF